MSVDHADLVAGQQISNQTYLLDEETVSKFEDAVGDQSRLCLKDDARALVPPMAVAALSLRGVVNDLEIPGGTLHAGQEIEFSRAISIGENLRCSATLLQNSVRGDWRFVVVQLQVEDSVGSRVMNGKSTIMLQV